MAEERTEAARAQSTQAVIDTDDLDNLATPESILLSAVSGEDAQDRSDRTILTPWVRKQKNYLFAFCFGVTKVIIKINFSTE